MKNNFSRVAFVVRSRREKRPQLPLSLDADTLLQSGVHLRQASLPGPKAAALRPHYKKSPCRVFLCAVAERGTNTDTTLTYTWNLLGNFPPQTQPATH
jgi:hypothetical protein